MENILNAINAKCVALADAEIKTNNVILHHVVDSIITELKKDGLFSVLFKEKFHGGSFYDGLRVGNSTEFDIDMLLVLPKILNPNVVASDKPGFVHVSAQIPTNDEKYRVSGPWGGPKPRSPRVPLETASIARPHGAPRAIPRSTRNSRAPPLARDTRRGSEAQEDLFMRLQRMIDPKTNWISAKKLFSWIEGLKTTALDQLCPNGNPLGEKYVNGKLYEIFIKDRKSGPAITLLITAKAPDDTIVMDVDLVPCFQFNSNYWPSKSKKYRAYDSIKHGSKDTFLAVPKLPNCPNPDFYWRLSFQEQERVLISGQDRLKPALKLIKKIRDHWDHKLISSYYIKTVFLWEVERRSKDFWNRPLSEVFLEMLKVYGECLSQRSIKYYWNSQYDLIGGFKSSTIDGFANKIKRIIADIEREKDKDPFVIAKHIVSAEEVEQLRREVTLGKKIKTDQCNNNCRETIDNLKLENEKLTQRVKDLEQELNRLKSLGNDSVEIGSNLVQMFAGMFLQRNPPNPNTL